jgi:hypothetical protein
LGLYAAMDIQLSVIDETLRTTTCGTCGQTAIKMVRTPSLLEVTGAFQALLTSG